MKTAVSHQKFIILTILVMTFLSCKKDNAKQNEHENPNESGGSISRPIGNSIGEAYFDIIGSEGGILKSPDGRIEINIPQGALTTSTEIGIEPIENTNSGGIGNGFRLTPHGQQFKKEVTISFSYKGIEKRISSEQTIQLAYQDDKGVWRCAGGVNQDRVNKKVSITTTHFSDWSFISTMELTPSISTVGLGGKVDLKAIRYIFPADKDGLVPLALPGTGMGEPIKLEQKYIVKWTLSGPGTLKSNGNEATYTAPSVKPNNKTATISVELNINGKMVLLIGTVYIIEDGLHISFNGGPWSVYPAIATKIDESNYSINNIMTSVDQPQITILFTAPGNNINNLYYWNMIANDKNTNSFQYFEPRRQHVYASIYRNHENETEDSGGILDLKEETISGKKYITGLFFIDPSGYLELSTDGEQQKTSVIHGAFRVLKSNQ